MKNPTKGVEELFETAMDRIIEQRQKDKSFLSKLFESTWFTTGYYLKSDGTVETSKDREKK